MGSVELTTLPAEVQLPSGNSQFADVDWFKQALNSNERLENFHMDAFFSTMAINYDIQLDNVGVREWTIIDRVGLNALRETDLGICSSVLVPYSRGYYPRCSGLRWVDCNRVFGFAWIEGCHWILYELSLKDEVIRVYFAEEVSWMEVKCFFDNVRSNLKKFIQWDNNSDIRDPSTEREWEVVRSTCFVGGPDGIQSGVMALKFLECLIYNLPLAIVDPACCASYRYSFCAQLFANCIRKV
ncbi:uncharacterized protein LOC131010556 [Salvia miltiorrhiza]|uniref:uncharacterized protein LOC131010556 n=1 Tax=Salvia miltiorrhiza TaxID=226208 RepID=UPI0025AC12A6|nr:uncharacterized protein LOC131010556 [Salvia miltiorrhiza]